MKKKLARLLSWQNREEDLAKVTRYRRFRVMFYRTNLALHSMRVQRLVHHLLPHALLVYPQLDTQKTLLISKYHDDHEMVSKRGDVPLQLKLQMNGYEKFELHQEEMVAAEMLSDSYGNPRIMGYPYRDLLLHSLRKDCPEAQLHSFADKLDGYGEALHEVLAGNTVFLDPVMNYVGKVFSNPPAAFPLIANVFRGDNGPFHFPLVDLQGYFDGGLTVGRPHTPASVMRSTSIPHYEMWKEVTLSLPNGMDILTRQIEPQASP